MTERLLEISSDIAGTDEINSIRLRVGEGIAAFPESADFIRETGAVEVREIIAEGTGQRPSIFDVITLNGIQVEKGRLYDHVSFHLLGGIVYLKDAPYPVQKTLSDVLWLDHGVDILEAFRNAKTAGRAA